MLSGDKNVSNLGVETPGKQVFPTKITKDYPTTYPSTLIQNLIEHTTTTGKVLGGGSIGNIFPMVGCTPGRLVTRVPPDYGYPKVHTLPNTWYSYTFLL